MADDAEDVDAAEADDTLRALDVRDGHDVLILNCGPSVSLEPRSTLLDDILQKPASDKAQRTHLPISGLLRAARPYF